MDTKDFKKAFNEIATRHSFENLFGAWFKESSECILALILVKSDYSKLYYLRIKVNLKNAFGHTFKKEKEWVKHDIAHVMLGPGKEFADLFDLEKQMDDSERFKNLEVLFSTNIHRLVENALSRDGLIELYKTGDIFLLPAIKTELGVN